MARGRAEIEQVFERLFARNEGARVRNEVRSTRLITPDVLLVDVTYALSGTSRPSEGRIFIVRLRRDGNWQTISQRTYGRAATLAEEKTQ